MIFPTRKKIAKGKSVRAVADFCSTINTKGKIAMADASSVQLTNGLTSVGAFDTKDVGVLQYLAPVDGDQVALKSNGLSMGVRTFTQFASNSKVVWAFDANQDTHVISAKNATYKIYSGNIYKISDISFASICFCQSRLFGLSGKRVHVTSPTTMAFEDDLWIDLPAECVSIVNNGQLYAIGNDIYKLNLDGDESHIKVTKICANVGDVIADTVCAYGNKIMFVANNKIVCLQQGTLKVIAQLDQTPACATMHDGLYYVVYYTTGNHVITSYNPHSGKMVTIHHVSAKNIYSCAGSLLISDGANGFELKSQPRHCYWKSQPINFDNNLTTKHLHRLVVQTEKDIDIDIVSNTRRSYHLKGKQTPQSLLITGHGKNITVELSYNGAMSVKYLSLTARPSEVSV